MRRAATAVRSFSTAPAPVPFRRNRSAAHRPSLLWVDDYSPGLELYRVMFENLGFNVLTASGGDEALKIAATNPVDVVVTDYEMPGMNGEAVAMAIKAMKPGVPVILFSGSTIVSPRARRVADAFCDKAGSRTQLSATIHRMLHKKATHALQPPPAARASDEGRRTVA